MGEGQGDVGLRYEFVTYRRVGCNLERNTEDGLIKKLDIAADIAIVASELFDAVP